MRMHLVRPHELDEDLLVAWRGLQAGNPALASPYFCPEFTQAVAAVRKDVFVTVIEEGGRAAGFFPFQRQWGAGSPVGGRLSDHHGVVASPHTRLDWSALLRSSGLGYWHFDHLAASQAPQGAHKHDVSHALDLSSGYEGYRQRKIDAGSETILKLERRMRKLQREVGPLRFEANTADTRVLETVIRLKLEQCRRTGSVEYFNWPWTRALVHGLHQVDGADFGGRLSALYVGDTLVAAHFGMRSRWVWHGWFTVYEQDWATWSPGSVLLLHMAQAAAREGHAVLDLGKGEEPFKKVFADRQLPLVEGNVARTSPATLLRDARKAAGLWLRSSPWAAPLRPLVRLARRSAVLATALALPISAELVSGCC